MSKANWYYYFEGQRAVGPLGKADLVERIRTNKLGPYQLVIRDGDDEWKPALALPEFRDLLLVQKTQREPSRLWIILKRQDAGGRLAAESLGPFTSDEVREHLQSGRIEYTDYVWKDGMHQWRRLSSLKEFSPFEKPDRPPEPLVNLPPAPQIAKQVSKAEVLKKVEVVNRKRRAEPAPAAIPEEAEGPDLAEAPSVPVQEDLPPPITQSRVGRLPRIQSSVVETQDPLPPPEVPADLPAEQAAPAQSRKKKREKESPSEIPTESVITAVKEFSNKRITLPRNWLQILIIVILLFALYVKLFGGPDVIPLSQVPAVPSDETPTQMPEPQPAPQAVPPSPPDSSTDAEEPADEVNQPTESAAAPQAPSAPTPEAKSRRPPVPEKRSHPATRLHVRMLVQGDSPSLQLDTDASPDQVVTIDLSASAGQVVDHSHYFKHVRWNPGSPLNMGGELPPGFYRLHAAVGKLTADERFEIGVHAKGFNERLKHTRKQSSYEYWSERKRLLLASRQLVRLLDSHRTGEIDRIARFRPTSFAFSDVWEELKEICNLMKHSDPSTKARLQALQDRISQLSIWK